MTFVNVDFGPVTTTTAATDAREATLPPLSPFPPSPDSPERTSEEIEEIKPKFDRGAYEAARKYGPVPTDEKIRILLEWTPADPRELDARLEIVLCNYADAEERRRIWQDIFDIHERIYRLENGLEDPGDDDRGDGLYGPLDVDQVVEQLREELETAIAAAADHIDF